MKDLENLKECLRLEFKKKEIQELQREQRAQQLQEQREKIQQKKRFDEFVNKM